MLMKFLITFASAALVSLLLTPWVIKLAARFEVVDRPNERKIHRKPTLLLGGLSVFGSFLLSLPLAHLLYPSVFFDLGLDPHLSKTILVSCSFMLMLGIWDDVHPLTPGNKFIVQVLVSTILYAGGVKISVITNPLSGGRIELGAFGYLLTILWIVGITNSLNLIDGLDGLASGITAISALTICADSSVHGDIGTGIMAMVLAGAVIGFLPYNFYPAKIFLGNSGSLFLGLVLAILSMLGSTKGSTAFALSVPMLALGVPIMDTLLAIVRRFLRRFLTTPSEPEAGIGSLGSIFQPDRDHIHHRLISLGLSQRDATLLLYVISGALGAGALAQSMLSHFGAILIMIMVGALAILGLWRLHYREMAVFNNGILLSLYDRSPLRKGWFQALPDLLFMAFAYVFCFGLVRGFRTTFEELHNIVPQIAIVSCVQVVMCSFAGLYVGKGRFYGPWNYIRISLAVTLAVGASGLVLLFLGLASSRVDVLIFLLDFFLLFSFLLVTSFAFRALYFISLLRRRKKLVLIFGTGKTGKANLEALLNMRSTDAVPVGFIDEDQSMRGRSIDGYPVHGGIQEIPEILKKFHIDEILVPAEEISSAELERLQNAVRGQRIIIQRLAGKDGRVTFEEITPYTKPGE